MNEWQRVSPIPEVKQSDSFRMLMRNTTTGLYHPSFEDIVKVLWGKGQSFRDGFSKAEKGMIQTFMDRNFKPLHLKRQMKYVEAVILTPIEASQIHNHLVDFQSIANWLDRVCNTLIEIKVQTSVAHRDHKITLIAYNPNFDK